MSIDLGKHRFDLVALLKAGTDVLLTWNHRDFIRFEEVARLVKTPLEFQDVE